MQGEEGAGALGPPRKKPPRWGKAPQQAVLRSPGTKPGQKTSLDISPPVPHNSIMNAVCVFANQAAQLPVREQCPCSTESGKEVVSYDKR